MCKSPVIVTAPSLSLGSEYSPYFPPFCLLLSFLSWLLSDYLGYYWRWSLWPSLHLELLTLQVLVVSVPLRKIWFLHRCLSVSEVYSFHSLQWDASVFNVKPPQCFVKLNWKEKTLWTSESTFLYRGTYSHILYSAKVLSLWTMISEEKASQICCTRTPHM